MKISSDYKDLLRSLNEAGVRYLIVGGYAVMIYTEPSFTKTSTFGSTLRSKMRKRYSARSVNLALHSKGYRHGISPSRKPSIRWEWSPCV